MSTTRKIRLTYNICMFVVDNNGWSDILEVPMVGYQSTSRRWFRGSTRGSLLSEAGRVDIPDVLVKAAGGGSALSRDPRVPHGAFRIIVCILQLVKVKVDLLRCAFLTMAAL